MDNFTSYGEDTPDSSGDESESSYERRNHYNFRPRKSSSSSHRSTPITRRSATIAPSPLRRRGNTSTSRTAQTRPKRARPRRGSTQTTSSISSTDLVKGSAGFAYDILGIVVWVVRKPLAWALALGLLYTLCGMLWIWARNSMFIALSPVCLIPGISGLELPFCKDTSRRAVGPDWGWGGRGEPKISGGDFPNLINLQTSFEALLEDSVSGTIMARDLKNSEIAVRDLNSLVKHSNLECRGDISNRLDEFVASAKSASVKLSRFGSRVRDAVDSLVAVDEFAVRALQNIQDSQAASVGQGGFTGFMLAPFRGGYDSVAAERSVLATFLQAARVMDTAIQKLIRDAEFTLSELHGLEEKLNVVEDIVQREKGLLSAKETEVLARIWTSLGGNRGQLSNYANHKHLLSSVSIYRKRALILVGRSLLQLQEMQGDLEVLRERVAEPGIVSSAGDAIQQVPLEVHINTISKGVSRLSESMAKAKDRENSYQDLVTDAYNEAMRRGLEGDDGTGVGDMFVGSVKRLVGK